MIWNFIGLIMIVIGSMFIGAAGMANEDKDAPAGTVIVCLAVWSICMIIGLILVRL